MSDARLPVNKESRSARPLLHLFALLLWCTLLVLVCVKALLLPGFQSVWPIYTAASRHWWEGKSLFADYPGLAFYRYSPTFAILLSPLAWLPVQLGGALWSALSILLLFASVRALERHVFPSRLDPQRRSVFLILAALGVAPLVYLLQANALIFSLAAWAAVAIVKERWWIASFLLAAAVAIKVWPLAVALLLIASWPRQLGGRFALALAVFALVPFLSGRPAFAAECYLEWFHHLNYSRFIRFSGSRDFWTVWEVIAPPVNPVHYGLLQLTSAFVLLRFCLACRYRALPQRQLLTAVLGGWICWQLQFGPASEHCGYGLVGPLMSWGVVVAWKERRGRPWMGLTFLLFTLCNFGEVEIALGRWIPGIKAVLPLSVAMYTVWLVRWMLTQPSASVDQGKWPPIALGRHRAAALGEFAGIRG